MSMEYCEKHDRERDTDWETHCPECATDLERNLEDHKARIEALRFDMYVAGCSDDRYHSNRRYKVHKMQLDALEAEYDVLKAKLDAIW